MIIVFFFFEKALIFSCSRRCPRSVEWFHKLWHGCGIGTRRRDPKCNDGHPLGERLKKVIKSDFLCIPSIKSFPSSLRIDNCYPTCQLDIRIKTILIYDALETGQQIFDPPLIKVVKNCNALSRLIRLMLET